MESKMVPFGKYKGQPIEVLSQDSKYLSWLQTQDWFISQYQSINNIIINNFQEPSETPEHNKIQTLFLDKLVMRKLLAYFISIDMLPKTYQHKTKDEELKYVDWKYETVSPAEFETREVDYTIHDITFEYNSIDVFAFVGQYSFAIEIKPTVSDDYPAIIRQMRSNKSKILVCERYTGTGATLEQVRQMFYMSGRLHFVLLSDFMNLSV